MQWSVSQLSRRGSPPDFRRRRRKARVHQMHPIAESLQPTSRHVVSLRVLIDRDEPLTAGELWELELVGDWPTA